MSFIGREAFRKGKNTTRNHRFLQILCEVLKISLDFRKFLTMAENFPKGSELHLNPKSTNNDDTVVLGF